MNLFSEKYISRIAAIVGVTMLVSNVTLASIATPREVGEKLASLNKTEKISIVNGYTPNEPVKVTTVPKGNAYIPRGTVLRVGLKEELTSKVANKGDVIPLKILHNIVINDVIVVPAGTEVVGKVIECTHSAGFGRGGKIKFTINTIDTLNGVTVPLTYQDGKEQISDPDAQAMIPICFIAAWLMKGKNVYYPEGEVFDVVVAADTDLKIHQDGLKQEMEKFH